MSVLFKKLGIGELDEIVILNEPEGFREKLNQLKRINVRESVICTSEIDFALIFVTEPKQIQNRIETVYPKLVGDAVLWFAYPIDASKRSIDITKDWKVLGDYNLKEIETLAIDENWIGIHFKKTEFL